MQEQVLALLPDVLPSEQAVQLDAPPNEKVPVAQVLQPACPVEPWYWPAGQNAHESAPLPFEYLPAGQAKHVWLSVVE
jgi:hypothetical protein